MEQTDLALVSVQKLSFSDRTVQITEENARGIANVSGGRIHIDGDGLIIVIPPASQAEAQTGRIGDWYVQEMSPFVEDLVSAHLLLPDLEFQESYILAD